MSRQTWVAVLLLGGVVAVATLVGAVVLTVKVWRTRKLLGELGMGGKTAFYGALIYTILPVDLLPDPLYLDDMAVLTGALIYLTRLVQQHRRSTAGRIGPPGTTYVGHPRGGPNNPPQRPPDLRLPPPPAPPRSASG